MSWKCKEDGTADCFCMGGKVCKVLNSNYLNEDHLDLVEWHEPGICGCEKCKQEEVVFLDEQIKKLQKQRSSLSGHNDDGVEK